jgi:hypothetical protein
VEADMATTKGPALEELVRAYFARQGFFVLRSVPYRFDDEDVTDLDVWLYARQAASVRIRAVVDVKNKKTPKAFERVLWVKGLQQAMKCDRALIATTDASPALLRFAKSQNIAVLSKNFLEKLSKKLDIHERLTLEGFVEQIQTNPAMKQDGDWLKILGDAKSSIASMAGFPAFNKAMFAFRFFAERAEVRIQHKDAALRCALLTAALACIALDVGLEPFVFGDIEQRRAGLNEGVMFGDSGDGRVQFSIDAAIDALSEGLLNGRAIAAQAREQLQKRLADIRAEVIAEYFMREHNAQHLFNVARELDEAAHTVGEISNLSLSLEAKSVLGVFADFVNVKRSVLPITNTTNVNTKTPPEQNQIGVLSSDQEKETLSSGGENTISTSQQNLL